MLCTILTSLLNLLPGWITRRLMRRAQNDDSTEVEMNQPRPVYGPWLPHGTKRKRITRNPDCAVHGVEVQKRGDEEEERLFAKRLASSQESSPTTTSAQAGDSESAEPQDPSAFVDVARQIFIDRVRSLAEATGHDVFNIEELHQRRGDGAMGAAPQAPQEFDEQADLAHDAEQPGAPGADDEPKDAAVPKARKHRRQAKKAKQREMNKQKKNRGV